MRSVSVNNQPLQVDIFYITGAVHAREWGSCEILINLAADLCAAYTGGTGVGYGGKIYSRAEVKAMVEQMNFILFPCVNPDGRFYSQNTDGMWRKNKNPADSTPGNTATIGVDINRNQDFLWDFRQKFDPAAVNIYLASDSPAIETYHGHAPATEQETKNINYIFDTLSTY
ncbi:MAG: M14 family zinc carboxypeptidase [Bacteroidota bacterium]